MPQTVKIIAPCQHIKCARRACLAKCAFGALDCQRVGLPARWTASALDCQRFGLRKPCLRFPNRPTLLAGHSPKRIFGPKSGNAASGRKTAARLPAQKQRPDLRPKSGSMAAALQRHKQSGSMAAALQNRWIQTANHTTHSERPLVIYSSQTTAGCTVSLPAALAGCLFELRRCLLPNGRVAKRRGG